MKRQDEYKTLAVRGAIRGKWIDPKTGCEFRHFSRNNTLSYACCDVLAQILGGNSAYVPRYMGFIYGTPLSPALTDPTSRNQSWDDLGVELSAVTVANIQISPITLTPSIVVNGDEAKYSGNGVIFSSHTRSGAAGDYGFPLTTVYADVLKTGDYLYHAMLLTKTSEINGTYIPIARVSLADIGDPFQAKPDGFELALEWQVSFF